MDLRESLREWAVPEHMHGPILRYLEDGVQPGGFLQSVIENDLAGAVGMADHINSTKLREIVGWFHNCAPAASWGSRENFRRWMIMRRAEARAPELDSE